MISISFDTKPSLTYFRVHLKFLLLMQHDKFSTVQVNETCLKGAASLIDILEVTTSECFIILVTFHHHLQEHGTCTGIYTRHG